MSSDRRSFLQRLAALFSASAEEASPQASAPASGGFETPPAMGGFIRSGSVEWIRANYDVVVVGGGISGVCAAIAAARNGAQTALVHERSMLGGNSSSESRLFPEDTCDAATWIKEGGILDEVSAEERVRNQDIYEEGLLNCHWDLVLYEWAIRETNLTLYLDTTMREVEMRDPHTILGIHAIQLGTEKGYLLEAQRFVDATGDGVLGYRAGTDFLWGNEASDIFNEPLAPSVANGDVMGNTLFFRARNAGRPVPFRRVEWAAEFDSEKELRARGHTFLEGGYWWLEVGYPMHPIHDNDRIKHEALRQLLGVWDHIKNRCVNKAAAANYGLDFVGFWPYKREARRLIGDYVLRQQDLQDPQVHEDDVAYGSWGIDIHIAGGVLRRHELPYIPPGHDDQWENRGTLPYGIPLRACYSRNVENLFMAGRPISASYIAFASSRVLPTGAIVGQAVGTAAAMCKSQGCAPREIALQHAKRLQQILLRQGCHIPGVVNEDPADLALSAKVTAGSEASLDFPESSEFKALRFPSAQSFPVSTSRIETVELLLKSELDRDIRLQAGLRRTRFVWDFRSEAEVAAAEAVIPARTQGYVAFRFACEATPGALYYIHLPAQQGISWALFSDDQSGASAIPVGTSAADLPGKSLWRSLRHDRAFTIRITPAQRPFGPRNVVTGTNRPDMWSNVYTSDPAVGLPAWLELQLPRAQTVAEIQLTFDTNTNRRVKKGLYRYPECVKSYEVAVDAGSGWKTVVVETDNYQRRRVHRFDAVSVERVRVSMNETNGASFARVFEVRLYAAAQA